MSMEQGRRPEREDWGPSKTKQSAEADSNINNIVRRFTKTGQLTHISDVLGEYRDMSDIPDLKEAMDIVADANSTFQELPAHIRKAMGHDAANFLPYIDDPNNQEQCEIWGLIPKTNTVPTAGVGEEVPPTPEPESAPE